MTSRILALPFSLLFLSACSHSLPVQVQTKGLIGLPENPPTTISEEIDTPLENVEPIKEVQTKNLDKKRRKGEEPQNNSLLPLNQDKPAEATAVSSKTSIEIPTPPKEPVQKIISGDFTKIDAAHYAQGDVKITDHKDQITIEFQSNFVAAPGPDLYVYLSDSQAFGQKAKNGADIKKMTRIGALISNQGTQTYNIDKAVWDKYNDSIVIWCREFGVLFSYANLR